MNRQLRKRHRLMFAVIAVIVPAVFIVGLAERPLMPVQTEPLPVTSPAFPAHERAVAEYKAELGRHGDLAIRLLAESGTGKQLVVEFVPSPAIVGPDVLAYWSGDAGAELPGNAILLGPVSGERPRRFLLPADATGRVNYFYLYSQATHALVGDAHAIDVPGSR